MLLGNFLVIYVQVGINSPSNLVSWVWMLIRKPSRRYQNSWIRNLDYPRSLVNMYNQASIDCGNGIMLVLNCTHLLVVSVTYPAPDEFPHSGVSSFSSSWYQFATRSNNGQSQSIWNVSKQTNTLTFIADKSFPVLCC